MVSIRALKDRNLPNTLRIDALSKNTAADTMMPAIELMNIRFGIPTIFPALDVSVI